jgi:hypothetical protein
MKCIYYEVAYSNLKGIFIIDADVLCSSEKTTVMSGPYCSYQCMVAEVKENVL